MNASMRSDEPGFENVERELIDHGKGGVIGAV
jgi:hypothetical protein